MTWSKWFRVGKLRILGASVYAHWSVLVVVALLSAVSLSSPVHAAVAIASYLAIIVIHEFGHAFAARRLGYEVRAIRIAFLHGTCEMQAQESEGDEILIAWGGVTAQLVVAVPVLAVARMLDDRDFGYLAPAIVFLGYVNFLVALINLAPGAGLDGSTAWRVFPVLYRRWKAKRATSRVVSRLSRRR